jgi:hypothetical protein
MPAAEPEAAPLENIRAELAKAPPAVAPVGFGNPQAVRIGLVVALLSFVALVLSGNVMVPAVSGVGFALPIFWLAGAGFLSVYLYHRRTGQSLTLGGGAHMGWMTGLFSFVIVLVLLTTIVVAVSDPTMASKLLADMKARGADVSAEAMFEAFRNPSSIVEIVLLSFVLFTLFPTLGGALGAKFLGRSR